MPTVGPGNSARTMCIECSPLIGITASMNTSTPMPPIHWDRSLHSMQLRLSVSTSVSTVAPVVEKPDTDSNSASTKSGMSPLKIYGSAPRSDMSIHARPTARKPSRANSSVESGFIEASVSPSARLSAMHSTNGRTFSPYIVPASSGTSISPARHSSTIPSTRPTIL